MKLSELFVFALISKQGKFGESPTLYRNCKSSYSLPTKEIYIKNQELALRRFAPQRVIFHWEGSKS